MTEQDIHQFLALFKQKDSKVITQFYHDNYPKALSFIYKNSGTEQDCKDVYQEAFIALWEKIDTVSFDAVDDIQGYFYRMVQYKWYDKLRARKKEKLKTQKIEHIEITEELNADDDRVKIIEQQLSKIGARCKKILKAFYYENKSYDTMAKEMDYSAEVLKTMKYRCVQKLKKQILETS